MGRALSLPAATYRDMTDLGLCRLSLRSYPAVYLARAFSLGLSGEIYVRRELEKCTH